MFATKQHTRPSTKTGRQTARLRFAVYKVYGPYDYYETQPENPANLKAMSILHPQVFIH
jgi:hypothetical protein